MKNPEPDKGSFFPAQEIGMIAYSLENIFPPQTLFSVKCLKLEKVKRNQTGKAVALRNSDKKLSLTWHADAAESAALVDAGALVHAGVALALVDVDLAPRAREAGLAIAAVGAGRVHAEAVVLAGRTWGRVRFHILIAKKMKCLKKKRTRQKHSSHAFLQTLMTWNGCVE